MLKSHRLLVSLLFLGCILVAPVSAANTQGLHWGVKEGDRFDFKVTGEVTTNLEFQSISVSSSSTLDEEIYIVIKSLPTIPDIVDSLTDIPLPSVDVYWKNGSTASLDEYVNEAYGFVIPVGNETLYKEIFEASIPSSADITVGGDLSVFTIEGKLEVMGAQGSIQISFERSTGVLARYHVTVDVSSSIGETHIDMTLERPIGLNTQLVLVAGGATIGLIALIVLIKRH